MAEMEIGKRPIGRPRTRLVVDIAVVAETLRTLAATDPAAAETLASQVNVWGRGDGETWQDIPADGAYTPPVTGVDRAIARIARDRGVTVDAVRALLAS